MKLFYSPGACSLGIHVLLEEIGAPYDLSLVNLREGQQFSPAFRAVNPKGKVPALLRPDGSVLTEFQSIAFWLAHSFPQAALLPDDMEHQIRIMELMDFIVASVHMRGFTLLKVPQKFAPESETAQTAIRAAGLAAAQDGLAVLSEALGDKEYFFGTFSVADAAAFYVTHWAKLENIPLSDALNAFEARMRARPAVARALDQEGL